MTYGGKRGRRADTAPAKGAGLRRETVRLAAAALLLAVAAGTRFLFPKELADFRAGVLEEISCSVPYKEAVSVFGEAIQNKENVYETAKKAWGAVSIQIPAENSQPETGEELHPIIAPEDNGEVRAEENGTVTARGESSAFGGYVIVRGDSGEVIYDGLDEVLASEGDEVRKGQLLGRKSRGSDET